MIFVLDTYSLLDLMFRTISKELHDEVAQRLHRGRPAGLGFLPFWLNFVYMVPEIIYAPKLMELINVSENHGIMVLRI